MAIGMQIVRASIIIQLYLCASLHSAGVRSLTFSKEIWVEPDSEMPNRERIPGLAVFLELPNIFDFGTKRSIFQSIALAVRSPLSYSIQSYDNTIRLLSKMRIINDELAPRVSEFLIKCSDQLSIENGRRQVHELFINDFGGFNDAKRIEKIRIAQLGASLMLKKFENDKCGGQFESIERDFRFTSVNKLVLDFFHRLRAYSGNFLPVASQHALDFNEVFYTSIFDLHGPYAQSMASKILSEFDAKLASALLSQSTIEKHVNDSNTTLISMAMKSQLNGQRPIELLARITEYCAEWPDGEAIYALVKPIDLGACMNENNLSFATTKIGDDDFVLTLHKDRS